jgi:hypothetical protein
MAKNPLRDVSIGKFDILATYTYAKALLDGHSDEEAKQRGMVAAIMGAQAHLGFRKEHHDDFQALKDAAEKKKKTSITAESFDHQVADKLGDFFAETFLPAMKEFVQAHFSYVEVKKTVKIPTTWGAKISGQQFQERAADALRKGRGK